MEIRSCESFQAFVNHISMDILESGFVDADREWRFFHINSPYNRLYIVLEGEGTVENEREKVTLRPGFIYLIPQHSTYDYLCNERMRKLYLHFRSELFVGTDIFQEVQACISIPFGTFPVEELLIRAHSREIADIIWCKGVFLQMVSLLASGVQEDIRRLARVAQKYSRLFSQIREEGTVRLDKEKLAAVMNVTPVSLSKAFKQDMGVTLKEYLDRQMVGKARELLLLTGDTIKQIACRMGFSDEFYFSRFFKRYTGISPNRYRVQNRMK
jgi:AraC-like DNA-binding protein